MLQCATLIPLYPPPKFSCDKEVIANALLASDVKCVFIPPSLAYCSPLLSAGIITAATWLAYFRKWLWGTTIIDLDNWSIDWLIFRLSNKCFVVILYSAEEFSIMTLWVSKKFEDMQSWPVPWCCCGMYRWWKLQTDASRGSWFNFNAEIYFFVYLFMLTVVFTVQRSFLILILTQIWAWWWVRW